MKPFGFNLIIAAMWMLLSHETSFASFFIGFLGGFVFVWIFHRLLGGANYVRRCIAFVRFVFTFIREFLVANAKVAWIVLFRTREALYPNFITYDVTGLKPFEILLLSYCISLTPGTTSVQIEDDFKTLIIHALNADNPDQIRADIDRSLKKSILHFTR